MVERVQVILHILQPFVERYLNTGAHDEDTPNRHLSLDRDDQSRVGSDSNVSEVYDEERGMSPIPSLNCSLSTISSEK